MDKTLYEKLYDLAMEDLKNGDVVVFFKHNNTFYQESLTLETFEKGIQQVRSLILGAKKGPHAM